MSGVGEASLVLGIISSIIAIVTAAKNVYDAANDASGLPKAFHNVAAKLPIVVVILKQASDYAQRPEVEEGTRDAFQKILCRCETSAKELRDIFERAIPKDGASRFDRGVSAAKGLRKGGRVEELIAEILKEISLLLASSSFATQKTLQRFDKAMEEVSRADSSLPNAFEAGLPLRVNSNGEGQVARLKEIRYAKDQIRRKSDNPKAYLAEWLLPQSMPLSNIVSEHNMYLEKQFSNPDSSYKTCSWFFESAEFHKFVEVGTSTVLRIQGSPGCGKSVLSSAIIHELASLDDGTNSPRVLFCYGCRDPEKTSSIALARILLAQTLQWSSPEMISEVEKFQQKYTILKDNDGKSEEELWRLLRSVLALQIQKVYIVVDGLDECAQPLMCVRSLVKVMTKLAASSHCGLLLSSRLQRRDLFENKNVIAALKKADVKSLQLEMTQAFTRQDLMEFVAFQVATRSSFLSSTQVVREKIITSVCEKAKGMFLYATLVLEDLKGETISSIADIDLTLANLPEDIFNTYRQNLEVPKRARRGLETFRWILCSNPALTWNELKSALAIGPSGYVEGEIILDSCDTFIEHTCGQLVESYGEFECLRFIHPTVKDFLLDSEGPSDGLDISGSDEIIASKMLIFLNYPDLPYFSSTTMESPEQIINAYSTRTGRGLYTFATFNWYKHLKKCGKRENSQLEIQVLTFLGSTSFIRWLKSAIIMSRASRDGRDSASLTTDVIDSLQSWAVGRSWCSDNAASKLQAWIQDFLDIMLDWGKVIERQPDWIHYLHPQLLSESSCFRETLEEFGDPTILQFDQKLIVTKRSEAVTWPSRCFVMDLERDLAFTYDEPFIACYHIKTGLLTAEILIPVPHNVRGPLVARRGVLCPQGKYLAVVFEAMGASTDPVGSQIRAGRRLNLNFESTGFKWAMDNALVSFDLSGILASITVGVDSAEFVICLLELQHTGPARTHLLGIPSWKTSPVLVTGSQMMRWDLDDVDVLQFSDNSSRLATAFGIFDLESGKSINRWQFALDHFYQGGKLTKDFKTFATILRDIEGGCILQLHDVNTTSSDLNEPARQEIRFTGIIHLLAISDHGRFLLLTRREPVEESKRAKIGKVFVPTQQVSIGVWDCRDGVWTPLLLLDREVIDKLPQWNLCTYEFEPCFGLEAQQENDVNRVLLHVPPKWKLSTNVRKVKGLNPEEAHLLLFEAKRSPKGFGKNPTLKLLLPAAAFRSEKDSSSTLQLMSWSPRFEKATAFSNSSITKMSQDQLKEATLTYVKHRDVVSQTSTVNPFKHDLQSFSGLLISATGSAIFYLKVSIIEENTDQHTLKDKEPPTDIATYHSGNFEYEITIECLLAGETQAMSSTLALIVPRDSHYSRSGLQYVCSSDETSLCLGFIEIDIKYGYEDMDLSATDVNQSVFEKALKAFNICAHPLKTPSSNLSTVGLTNSLAKTRYAIFEDAEIKFENFDNPLDKPSLSFIIQGDTFTEDHRHVFQISRPLVKNLTKNKDREARQFETYLCVYDEVKDNISWMFHSATGGDIAGSRKPCPETSWALHPELPLLAWLLPGHKLRISNIETHDSPITIAESLAIETDLTQAVKFSPEGRYVLAQAREAFKNDFMSLKRSQNLWSVILCDLKQGKSIRASLASESNVSIDLDDNFLHTYRLTRDGAIEDSTYKLPALVLAERQYLTFLPANCCCTTCGQSFNSQCTVLVLEYEGVKSAILGHTPVGLGKTSIHTETCQPLIIRITTPPVDLNVDGIPEAMFCVGSTRLFPRILDDQVEIIEGAFQEPHRTCTKNQEVECACSMCIFEAAYRDDSLELTRIAQMTSTMSNFKVPSGLALPPGQIEELHRLAELNAAKEMSIWKDSELSAATSVDRYKRVLGEEIFPWDSWAEFRETMEDIKDEFNHQEYMKRLFEPGNCGIGCQIPLFVYTFYFGDSGDGTDFQWSAATATGWLEEDLEWYFERFFGGDFAGSRRWYEFPAYEALVVKMDKLREDKTSKGRRFRAYFGPKTDDQGKVLEIELPEKEKKHVFERDGIEFGDDMKPMIGGLIMKDVFESMSDLVPGLGKIFEQRLHTMLNQSLIKELEE